MQSARKSEWFQFLFDVYNQRLLRRHFHAFHVHNTPRFDGPVIVYANHVSWWDGLLLFHLNRHVWNRDAYVLMGREGLSQYAFFRRMGAFSVNQDATDVLRGFRYALDILSRPYGLLAWFPQGKECHPDAPLVFADGLASLLHVAKRHGINPEIVPMTIRYEFLEQKLPEIFVSFGEKFTLEDLVAETATRTADATVINCNLVTKTEDIIHRVKRQIMDWSTLERRTAPGFVNLLERR